MNVGFPVRELDRVIEMEKCWIIGVLSVACCAFLLFGVKGYPIEDLVERLPGQPRVNFKQYAGYVDIDLKHGRSFFYYFVEAVHDPHHRPLTLWLNGGPGCSSIGGGAFTELGPFYPSGDGRSLRRNKKSWNRVSNLLFVESPAGVGWSYSNTTSDYTIGDTNTANDMLLFMLKWYEKFPSYKSRNLLLTGESYAGHYIPQLTNVMLDYNAQSSGFKFNIKGVAIGNPLLTLESYREAKYVYYWSHGMISDELSLAITKECSDFNNLSLSCNKLLIEADNIVADHIDTYDVILDICYPSIVQQELRLKKKATKISLNVDVCMNDELSFYLNIPEVQKALHANRTKLHYQWSDCSDVVYYNETDMSINILPVLKRIVEQNIRVWVYSGDQDSVVPLIGTRALVRQLGHDLKFNITIPYRNWLHKGQVGGWNIEYGNLLTYATVRGGSHMVPYSQPSRALRLFSSFVHGARLPNTTTPITYY